MEIPFVLIKQCSIQLEETYSRSVKKLHELMIKYRKIAGKKQNNSLIKSTEPKKLNPKPLVRTTETKIQDKILKPQERNIQKAKDRNDK